MRRAKHALRTLGCWFACAAAVLATARAKRSRER